MDPPMKLTLQRSLLSGAGWLAGGVSCVLLAWYVYVYTAVDMVNRTARALIFGAIGAYFLGTLLYHLIPVTVEVDEAGVRRYRNGQLRMDIPWDRVAWVAYGKWPPAYNSRLPLPNTPSLLVQGHHMRQFVTFNEFSFRVTHDAMTRFAESVVALAKARDIQVFPNPLSALGLGRRPRISR